MNWSRAIFLPVPEAPCGRKSDVSYYIFLVPSRATGKYNQVLNNDLFINAQMESLTSFFISLGTFREFYLRWPRPGFCGEFSPDVPCHLRRPLRIPVVQRHLSTYISSHLLSMSPSCPVPSPVRHTMFPPWMLPLCEEVYAPSHCWCHLAPSHPTREPSWVRWLC